MGPARDAYRFGRFELRPQRRQLLADGAAVKVGARAFDLLCALVERRDRQVAKAELLALVWPGVVVEENNLEVHVWALRKLIGADAIATIPGRGYRFTQPLDGDPPAVAPATGSARAAASAPAAAARRGPPSRWLVPLVGREAELADLQRLLVAGPLVTITGAGGIGKTLLARHAVQQQREGGWPHGTCWADLAPLTAAGAVVGTIAVGLGAELRGSDPLAALAAAVAPLSLLLVLDNAEVHADEAARVVATLLAAAPGLTVLVTSQVPLKLAAERLLPLGPLGTPDEGCTPEAALRCAAVALFIDRSQPPGASSARAANAGDIDAIGTTVRRLDGNPLAIELAAARVPLLGIRGVAASLGERLRLLADSGRVPDRQRSLRAALLWSHSLLSAREQRVFRRLGVFAGSFPFALAQPVVTDAGGDAVASAAEAIDVWAALAALDSLVQRSLAVVLDGEPPRYRLLESPAALAREQLQASGERAAIEARHARAVCDRLDRLFEDGAGGQIPYDTMRDELEAELDNGRAAFTWAMQHDDAMVVEMGRSLANALTYSRREEVETVLEAALARRTAAATPQHRLGCLLAAVVTYSVRRTDRALALAEEAIALARQLGERRSLARLLGILAQLPSGLPAPERRAALDEMLVLVQPDWPAPAQINAASAECIWAYHEGDLDRVGRCLRRWHEQALRAGSSVERDTAQINLVHFALARGDGAEAVQIGRELEARWAGSRQMRWLAVTQLALTEAHLACDDAAAAREVATRGWPSARAWSLQAVWGVQLALLAALEGRLRSAALLWGYAEARLAEVAGQRFEPNQVRSLARIDALLRAGLSAAEIERLREDGAAFGEHRCGEVAFARADSAARGDGAQAAA